ncbi:Mycobacterium numidiamassiliense ORFan [Mycobacterium numidiamassiliense]|uniref:Mycobacterium numidiamassiliense ORFan n=1 Tax=Mycobacterium numidiamassiliense TaxID=1841861 RepID=A0A2U3PFM5_9MYCO|nr:Mycobacterium numidiamassiliense ORFan [Mycobacterium numidiamassiliense]
MAGVATTTGAATDPTPITGIPVVLAIMADMATMAIMVVLAIMVDLMGQVVPVIMAVIADRCSHQLTELI